MGEPLSCCEATVQELAKMYGKSQILILEIIACQRLTGFTRTPTQAQPRVSSLWEQRETLHFGMILVARF